MTALDATSSSRFCFLIHGSTAKTTSLFHRGYYPVFEFAFAVAVMVRCAYFGNYYIREMASNLDLFVGNVCLTPNIEELLPAMIRGYNGILWGNINERISLNLIISKYWILIIQNFNNKMKVWWKPHRRGPRRDPTVTVTVPYKSRVHGEVYDFHYSLQRPRYIGAHTLGAPT